jgi:hypothetical protein
MASLVNWFNIYTQQNLKHVKNSLPYIILTKTKSVIFFKNQVTCCYNMDIYIGSNFKMMCYQQQVGVPHQVSQYSYLSC